MKKIKLLLFDLDGTLIDSKRDIADSVHYTLKSLGLPPIEDELIYSFVGHGVGPLIQQSIEASGSHTFEKAMDIFKAHYNEHLLDTTQLFEGAEEVLKHFQDIPQVVITNKSQGYSEKIVEGLGLKKHFKGVYGGDTKFPKKPDPTIVHHLIKEFQSAPQQTIIIGDSHVDVETGKNAGILTCGATYGFRPLEELKSSKPDFLINQIRELIPILTK